MKNQKGISTLLGIIIIIVVAVVLVGGVFVYQYFSTKAGVPPQVQSQQQNQNQQQQTINQTSTIQKLADCGSFDDRFQQLDYQPTGAERDAWTKSLTCINLAIINCSPARFVLNRVDRGNNITATTVIIKGQGKLGCDISASGNGKTIMCPMPPNYIASVKSKFDKLNYDGSIILDVITNIGVSGANDKTGYCTVTNTK